MDWRWWPCHRANITAPCTLTVLVGQNDGQDVTIDALLIRKLEIGKPRFRDELPYVRIDLTDGSRYDAIGFMHTIVKNLAWALGAGNLSPRELQN